MLDINKKEGSKRNQTPDQARLTRKGQIQSLQAETFQSPQEQPAPFQLVEQGRRKNECMSIRSQNGNHKGGGD